MPSSFLSMLKYVGSEKCLRKFCEREVKKTEFGFCSRECENKPRGPARLEMTKK